MVVSPDSLSLHAVTARLLGAADGLQAGADPGECLVQNVDLLDPPLIGLLHRTAGTFGAAAEAAALARFASRRGRLSGRSDAIVRRRQGRASGSALRSPKRRTGGIKGTLGLLLRVTSPATCHSIQPQDTPWLVCFRRCEV